MMLARILQAVLDLISSFVSGVLGVLPDSPFLGVYGYLGQWARWISYFIPIAGMFSLLSVYVGAVAVWYGVRWILRFSKYIS